MNSDDFTIVFEYIDLLEAEVKSSNPDRFLQLTQKREKLLPLLQKQHKLIATLSAVREADQLKIAALQAENIQLQSRLRAFETRRQGSSNAGGN